MKYLLCLSLLIAMVFFACEESPMEEIEEDPITDYRDEFTGEYAFLAERNSSNDTTFQYLGYVEKSTGSDNEIVIHWGTESICTINGVVHTQTTEAEVDSSGWLTFPWYLVNGVWNSPFVQNDSIFFILDCGTSGGGGTFYWRVTGNRVP
jgi:hypothetical protein